MFTSSRWPAVILNSAKSKIKVEDQTIFGVTKLNLLKQNVQIKLNKDYNSCQRQSKLP